MSDRLLSVRHTAITLADAARDAFGESSADGLMYRRDVCDIVHLDRGTVSSGRGEPSLERCYEARLFDGARELRWLRSPTDDADRGTAVISAESAAHLPPTVAPSEPGAHARWTALTPINSVIEPLERTYLLWGTTRARPGEWVATAEARVGALLVHRDALGSVPVAAGERLALIAREYVAEDEHGNAYVAEERLVRFAVAEHAIQGNRR